GSPQGRETHRAIPRAVINPIGPVQDSPLAIWAKAPAPSARSRHSRAIAHCHRLLNPLSCRLPPFIVSLFLRYYALQPTIGPGQAAPKEKCPASGPGPFGSLTGHIGAGTALCPSALGPSPQPFLSAKGPEPRAGGVGAQNAPPPYFWCPAWRSNGTGCPLFVRSVPGPWDLPFGPTIFPWGLPRGSPAAIGSGRRHLGSSPRGRSALGQGSGPGSGKRRKGPPGYRAGNDPLVFRHIYGPLGNPI